MPKTLDPDHLKKLTRFSIGSVTRLVLYSLSRVLHRPVTPVLSCSLFHPLSTVPDPCLLYRIPCRPYPTSQTHVLSPCSLHALSHCHASYPLTHVLSAPVHCFTHCPTLLSSFCFIHCATFLTPCSASLTIPRFLASVHLLNLSISLSPVPPRACLVPGLHHVH